MKLGQAALQPPFDARQLARFRLRRHRYDQLHRSSQEHTRVRPERQAPWARGRGHLRLTRRKVHYGGDGVILHFLIAALAADGVTSAELELYPNYHAVSLELRYQGDDDGDCRPSFQWRVEGEDGWRNGVDMTDDRKRKLWWASIWPLEPGTAVEVKLALQDPDGCAREELTGKTRTRVMVDSASGRVLRVARDGSGTHRTVASAANSASPGTTVVVSAGVYREGIRLSGKAGRPGDPIVIQGEKGAVIDCSEELPPKTGRWKQVAGEIYSLSLPFEPGYVAQDGMRMYLYRSMGDIRKDPQEVKRCWFYDSKKKLIHVRTGLGGPPEDHTYNFSKYRNAFLLEGCKHIVIKGLEMRYASYSLIHMTSGCCDCRIIDNVLHNAANGLTINRPTSHNNAIWRNYVYEKGLGDFSWKAIKASNYGRGGIGTHTGRGLSIVGNVIDGYFDSIAPSVWKRPEELQHNRDSDIMYNDCLNAGDDAFEPDGCGVNMRFHGNRTRNTLAAISLAPVEKGPVYVTRNNCTYKLLMFKLNVGPPPSLGPAYSYHNSCYALIKGTGTAISFSPTLPTPRKVFKNNAFVAARTAVREADRDCYLDYDCFHGSSRMTWRAGVLAKEPHAIFKDPQFMAAPGMWAWAWQGYGTSRLYDHPQVKDASGPDFRLRSSSPCIDRGVLIRGVNEDFCGRAPDIGCHEFGGKVEAYGTAYLKGPRPTLAAAGRPPKPGESVWALVAKRLKEGEADAGADEHAVATAEARRLASKGDYAGAAARLRAVGNDALEPLARGFEEADRFKDWIIEGSAGGKQVSVFVDFAGTRMRGKLAAADGDGITVDVLGNEVGLGWDRLSPRKLASLAKKCCPATGDDRARIDAFLRSCGIEE